MKYAVDRQRSTLHNVSGLLKANNAVVRSGNAWWMGFPLSLCGQRKPVRAALHHVQRAVCTYAIHRLLHTSYTRRYVRMTPFEGSECAAKGAPSICLARFAKPDLALVTPSSLLPEQENLLCGTAAARPNKALTELQQCILPSLALTTGLR